ncbi:hypothetical protein C4544_00165 [candidate division WS5 bacterium]|uniref:Uncharacterized protein n=1 Tax=candidate division WS5 bacterium TaxID=2093353 RepID=A0A419DGR1_9BACT|nr:MAG: hypothetical protein C4544_00165 [candidate division WS5 bacterium]
MNYKRVYIIAATLSLLVVFLTVFAIILLATKKDEKKENQLIPFSTEFIKDFSTFSYKDSKEYNKRMEKYIAPSYYPDFKSRLLLRDDMSAVPASKREKYSKYKSSKVSIISETENKSTISIEYISIGTDPPVRMTEFETQRKATIVVQKIKDKKKEKFEIISFQFANISL